ncbi:MAG: DUF6092 family protein [Dehalococcoidia bacterium]|nr:DUF6092 family protein [Dehalococcoidia bacterium]
MKNKMKEEKLRYELLKLFCYIVTSARGCVDEPKLYGPFRLIDSVERIITLLDNEGLADDFLKKERAKIEENKYILMEDEKEFIKLLDELVIDFTRKLKESTGKNSR